jgi:hypothetical protein
MGLSISNQLLGSTGLSVGLGLSRGNGLSFGGFAGGPALYLPFALTGTLDPRITFSRPSLATMYDSTGKLTYAPNNLSLNSQNFSGANWAASNFSRTTGQADPFGGTSATLGTFTSNGGSGLNQSGLALPSDRSHIVSIYARFGTWRWFEFTTVSGSATRSWVDMQNGVAGATVAHSNFTVTSVGSGWFRISAKVQGAAEFYWTPRDGDGNAGAAVANNGATFFVYGFQAEAVTYQTTPSTYNATTSAAYYGPRFDYDPATLVARGLLIEEARTNLVPYSQQINAGGSWTLTAIGVPTTTTSPDGTSNAYVMVPTAAAAAHFFFKNITVTAAAHTWTFYAKANGYNFITLNALDPSGPTDNRTWFNLGTGAVATNAAGNTASIVSIGNGWYRCSVTRTVSAGSSAFEVVVSDADNTISFTGNGTSGVYAFGAQLEAGAFATSYIPTAASAVARSADSADIGPTLSSWLNTTAFSIIQSGQFLLGVSPALSGGAGTTAGLPIISMVAATPRFDLSGVAVLATSATASAPAGSSNKIGVAYAIGSQAIVNNGGAIAVGTNVANTPAVSGNLFLGVNMWHASYTAYNTRLPDATLQSLTLPVIADYYFLVDANGDQLTDASGNALYTQPLYL